jgi:hypothetical protein
MKSVTSTGGKGRSGLMRVTFRKVDIKGRDHPWLMWYYAHKDGSPVLIGDAKWWKHIHGVVIGRKYEIIFRHHEWNWATGRYEA